MTWAEIVIHVVVLGVGFPASLRNSTAAALTASWLVGQATWWITGSNLPLGIYFMADIAVVTVIYAKAIMHAGPNMYKGFPSFVTDLSVWDRWIVGSFVFVVWPVYALNLSDYTKWYLLSALVIAQFLLAGGEALQGMRKTKTVRSEPPPPSGLAYAGGGDV